MNKIAGRPTAASSSSLARSLAAAARLTGSVKSRHAGTFGGRSAAAVVDPDGPASEDEGDPSLELWKLLPQLKDLPEALLRKLPLSTMFQLNSALAKEKKTSEKLGVNTKLAHNAKKLARNPATVEKGVDNRKDQMHPARFLGGTSCALTEQWAEARRILGESGVLPIGNYDLDAVGCGGCVTPKAWLEIHNPASQDLKLKLFHLPNVASGGLSSKKESGSEDSGESLKEIADMDSFRIALNTAREAMASALPWNRSFSAVVGFMLNTNYLFEELSGNNRRAAILSEFVDYIIGRNGLNWENNQPFLTTDELAHVWANWRTKRGITSKPAEKKEKKDHSSSGGADRKKQLSEICRLFNAKTCRCQGDKECKTAWGKTLRHICNKYIAGGKMCLKDHPRADHV